MVKEISIDLNRSVRSPFFLDSIFGIFAVLLRRIALLSKRDCGIDMLRFFACCAVVGLHTFTKGTTLPSTVVYYTCGFAIPIFFMSSGAFLLNRGGVDYSYVAKKLCRLLVVLVLWASVISVSFVLGKLMTGVGDAASVVSVFSSTLLGSLFQIGLLSHGWFLWALAIVYCFLPLLSNLSLKGKLSTFFLFTAFGGVLHALSCVAGFPLESYIPQTFRVWIWFEYFLLGGLLYPLRNKFIIPHMGTALIVTNIVAVAWQMFAGFYLMPEVAGSAHAEYFYDGLPCVILCAIIFMCFINLKTNLKLWVYLSSLTMGVYHLHMFVVRVVGHFISLSDPVGASGVGFTVVLLITFCVIGFLKKCFPKIYELYCEV